jgi:hypothetical protein
VTFRSRSTERRRRLWLARSFGLFVFVRADRLFGYSLKESRVALTLAQMNALLADNTAGDISAADMRDVVAALDARSVIHVNLIGSPSSFSTYNNAPNSLNFWTANSRVTTFVDLSDMRQARLVVGVNTASASPNSPVIRLLYHTSFSSSAGDYVSIAASGNIEVSLSSQGVFVSSWVDLAAGAKADVVVGAFSDGGDSDKDPNAYAVAQFR